MTHGITINGEDVIVMLREIVADTPGRCFIKANDSELLEKISLPIEIHRKLRYWKGSECASFLHYASIVILKQHLPESMYIHFMLLFCAVTLFSSAVYEDKWQFAGQTMRKFTVKVQRFRSLSSISTYPFENQLQHLKKSLRSGWKNLEQAVNRLSEYEEFNLSKAPVQKYPSVSEKGKITTVYVCPRFLLRNNPRNYETVVNFNGASQNYDGNINIKGHKQNVQGLVINDPMKSSELSIYKGFKIIYQTLR
uniref:Uncharacterized protein n=1 Tax=Anopheles funestus TaxID=62324 RepID=A0A182S0A4_ANOFN